MSSYAVIVQNDESPWNDVKGDLYHYPSSYKNILKPGCKIVYYKGRLLDKKFETERLSKEAHYFGTGVIGSSIRDPDSEKHKYYCEISEYKEFESAVLAKSESGYLEKVPESRRSNYWRFGVRQISVDCFNQILNMATIRKYIPRLPSLNNEFESLGQTEGNKKFRYSTYYERSPINRDDAIRIHGLSCLVCGFNFEKMYGEHGKGFIHIHHNKPISETGPTLVDPENDLVPLCPNCHAMAHRRKSYTLSIAELRKLLKS